MAQRIGAILTLKIDGRNYKAKGNFTYNLGVPKREMVTGHDSVHGYKEIPQSSMIEGEITDQSNLSYKDLARVTDATVSLELSNGKLVVLREAVFTAEGTGNTEEGNLQVKFESEHEAEEIKL